MKAPNYYEVVVDFTRPLSLARIIRLGRLGIRLLRLTMHGLRKTRLSWLCLWATAMLSKNRAVLFASASAPVAGPPAPGSSPASWWRDPAVMTFQEPLTDSALLFQADLREVLLEAGRYQPTGDVQKDADACDPASSGVATVTRLDARIKAC